MNETSSAFNPGDTELEAVTKSTVLWEKVEAEQCLAEPS